MEYSAKGLRVVVTAGAAGIGRAIARTFVEHGARMHICDIDETALKAMSSLLPQVTQTRADVASVADVERLFQEAKRSLGGLDVLVNNAGIAGPTAKVEDIRPEDWERCIAVDLNGMFYCTRKAMPMIKAAGGGSIINIGSISATVISTNRGEYCIGKAGIAMMTKLWATRLGEFGIPVYEIQPGIIATDMTSGVKEKYDRLISEGLTVQKRWGFPEDIGKTTAALARGDLPYSTGQVIMADGGLTLPRL
jgi:3-oxoacyl-[acyl-carrier protein] reductase